MELLSFKSRAVLKRIRQCCPYRKAILIRDFLGAYALSISKCFPARRMTLPYSSLTLTIWSESVSFCKLVSFCKNWVTVFLIIPRPVFYILISRRNTMIRPDGSNKKEVFKEEMTLTCNIKLQKWHYCDKRFLIRIMYTRRHTCTS